MTGGYWFKPKTRGYGAYPSNWKGWAAVGGFMVATWLILWPWMLSPALAGEPPTSTGIVATLLLVAVASLGFVQLCRTKTEGDWYLRRGGKA